MNDMLVDLVLILNPWADQTDAKLLGQNGLLKRRVQSRALPMLFLPKLQLL